MNNRLLLMQCSVLFVILSMFLYGITTWRSLWVVDSYTLFLLKMHASKIHYSLKGLTFLILTFTFVLTKISKTLSPLRHLFLHGNTEPLRLVSSVEASFGSVQWDLNWRLATAEDDLLTRVSCLWSHGEIFMPRVCRSTSLAPAGNIVCV